MTSTQMTTLEFKTPFETNGEKAFEIISNPKNLVEIHPLITKVEAQGDSKFICHESTHIFFMPYRFHYSVSLTKVNDHQVIMESEVQKGVWIKLIFEIGVENGTSVLSEKIEIVGPTLVRRILSGKMQKAHTQMFQNLKKLVAK